MLYNPQWDYSLDGLIRWLETKRGDEEYRYIDTKNCALAQFNAAIGRLYEMPDTYLGNPSALDVRLEQLARAVPHTFGDLLHRARIAKNPPPPRPWWKFW